MARQKQLTVTFTDDLRERLEEAASAAGVSIAEEVRKRLERTLEEDCRPIDRKLIASIFYLAHLVYLQTGQLWNEHAGANEILRHAVDARIKRIGGAGDTALDPTWRARLVESDDLKTVGLGLEALNLHAPTLGRDWNK